MNVKCSYINGVMDGPFEQYNKAGELEHKGVFKDGKVV